MEKRTLQYSGNRRRRSRAGKLSLVSLLLLLLIAAIASFRSIQFVDGALPWFTMRLILCRGEFLMLVSEIGATPPFFKYSTLPAQGTYLKHVESLAARNPLRIGFGRTTPLEYGFYAHSFWMVAIILLCLFLRRCRLPQSKGESEATTLGSAELSEESL